MEGKTFCLSYRLRLILNSRFTAIKRKEGRQEAGYLLRIPGRKVPWLPGARIKSRSAPDK